MILLVWAMKSPFYLILSDSVVYATNQNLKFFQLKNDVNTDKKESSSIDLKTETSHPGSINPPGTKMEVEKLKSAEKKKKREKVSQKYSCNTDENFQ